MRVKLPVPLRLSCPSCGLELATTPAIVEQRIELTCLSCGARSATYFWLSPTQRQEIAAQLRSRIYYEAHRLNVGRDPE